jgi:hypothetical protein
MRTLEIRPEEILILSEFRYSELKKIKMAMDMCTVEADLSDSAQKESHDFFVKNFYSWVNSTIEHLEDGS